MKTLLTILAVLYSSIAFGQLDLSNFDKESFLIGTLDDYMGRQQTFTASVDSFDFQKVDIYAQSEKGIALLIDSLFKDEYNDLYITNNNAPKGIKLYSKPLAAKVNEYYNFKSTGGFTMYGDTVYTGYLIPEKFSTESRKLSFLAGAFLRSGGKFENGTYYITIPNSPSKARVCANLLKEMGCTDVSYEMLPNYIPVGHWVYFRPSQEVENILQQLSPIKKIKPLPNEFREILKEEFKKVL
ncbi:MAG: hypothetical protein LBV43_01245 [Prevotella sp.]|jgi:hypothetical protein|nr:hypothetical protein [Prevotella sp.]